VRCSPRALQSACAAVRLRRRRCQWAVATGTSRAAAAIIRIVAESGRVKNTIRSPWLIATAWRNCCSANGPRMRRWPVRSECRRVASRSRARRRPRECRDLLVADARHELGDLAGMDAVGAGMLLPSNRSGKGANAAERATSRGGGRNLDRAESAVYSRAAFDILMQVETPSSPAGTSRALLSAR
jgi:hypothetical protein